jgi:hypothetical protein
LLSLFGDARGIAAQRLANQRLVGLPFAGAAEAVRSLGAVPAQEYAIARWSIGQRADGLTESAVDQALAEGSIVRTHVLRDTWHLVAAEDLRWLVEVTRSRIEQRNASTHRRLGLDERLLASTDALIVEALGTHGPLTRIRLSAYLDAHRVEAKGPRLAYMLMHAELGLLICSGPMEGRRHTYALVEERVPAAAPLGRDRALAELARRYFGSHGPATVRDFCWWASLTAADARRAIELAGAELARFEVEGRPYWWSPSTAARPPEAALGAHLLQGYDEYVIAYSESRDVVDLAGLARIVSGRATFTHVFVLDGQVAGHWRRRLVKGLLAIDVQLARPLRPRERRALDDAVERYGRFVELPAAWAEA